MKRIEVKVINVNSQEQTHGASFDTVEEAQSWIDSQISNVPCAWGKLEHQVEVLDEEGLPLDPPQFETIPCEFEVQILDNTVEVEKSNLIADKIAKGKAARVACDNVLNLISGFNQERELTQPQIMQMISTFANADTALTKGMPKTAKAAIEAIVPDQTLVTQEMKDLCLELLAGW